jgi:two-component system, NarL family, nitrate/nitrite response regulator NarL
LLREGIASVLRRTSYKVLAGVALPSELEPARFPTGRRVLTIIGLDGKNEIDDAAENIQLLRSLVPDSKIVLILETNGSVDLSRFLPLAFDSCVVNLRSPDILVKALELTLLNQRALVFGRAVGAWLGEQRKMSVMDVEDRSRGIQFSHRERQVLVSLAHGESNKAIARLCQLSEATIKVYLKAVLRKTNAKNRTQAAIWAIKHGFHNAALDDHTGQELIGDAPSLSPTDAGTA